MFAVVAVLSAVAMSNPTPPAPAGTLRLTVNEKVVVPALPSFCDTSLMESDGVVDVGQTLKGDADVAGGAALLRVSAAKSLPPHHGSYATSAFGRPPRPNW